MDRALWEGVAGKRAPDRPRPGGPAEYGCPKRRGQSRVTAIPPPRPRSSPLPHGRRSLRLPLCHWRAARMVQKGRAPRRETSSPGCPRLTRVQKSGSGSPGKPSFGQPAPARNNGHAQCFLLSTIPLRVFPATRRGGCGGPSRTALTRPESPPAVVTAGPAFPVLIGFAAVAAQAAVLLLIWKTVERGLKTVCRVLGPPLFNERSIGS